MFKFASDFWDSKTTWAAISAIGVALSAGINHQMSWVHVALTIVAALFGAAHRDTIAKAAEVTEDFHSDLLYLYNEINKPVPVAAVAASSVVEPVDGEAKP